MNADIPIASAGSLFRPRLPLAGFRNYLRKDLLEWVRTKRAITTAVIVAGLLSLGASIGRLQAIFGDAATKHGANLDPSSNVQTAGWDPLIFLIAAFITMGAIAAEREHGTLAWSLSMPLDRPAVLVAKLVSALAMFAVCAIVVPDVVVALVARVAYGSWPTLASLVWMPLAVYAAAVFVIVVNVAVGTFVRSQAFVVGTTICVTFIGPGLLHALSPQLARLHPSFIQLAVTDFGAGRPVDPATPIAWAAAIIFLVGIAIIRFRRVEL